MKTNPRQLRSTATWMKLWVHFQTSLGIKLILSLQQTMVDCPIRIIPDINLYQNKKSWGSLGLDFALLITNVNQLRHIFSMVETGTPIFYISLMLVFASVILQIVVGIFLTINCRYDVKNCDDICKANRINNWITAMIFLITAINVVIPSLGIPDKEFEGWSFEYGYTTADLQLDSSPIRSNFFNFNLFRFDWILLTLSNWIKRVYLAQFINAFWERNILYFLHWESIRMNFDNFLSTAKSFVQWTSVWGGS